MRSVREILAGHGPVYSAFERAEPTTSTLWMWLVAGCGWITGGDVAQLALAVGGLLAIGGLAIALDATRRFHRASGHAGGLWPAGAWVVIGMFPFWDFATSGLETGLAFFWLAGIWWLLVTLRPDSGPGRLASFSVFVGLGPLVRPELALATAVFLAAGFWTARSPVTRALWLAGLALALPVAYEVFRAGYYGTLVPLPALAKSASHAEWSRGYEYLMRLVKPHLLYVPAAVLAAVVVANRRTMVAPRRVVFAAPLVAAALLALYVIRVGGDFMHARLLLPATFLMVAPVLLVPRGRWIGPAAALAARHAMTCGDLAELLTSVRAPMTASRFWANLAGSVRRTRLIIPADPVEAERALCGP